MTTFKCFNEVHSSTKHTEQKGEHMKWHCTVESAEEGVFSPLALLESVLAVSLSLYIAWHYQTYWHIAVASCLAPFLLLRTDESTRKGLQLFHENWHPNLYLFQALEIVLIAWFLSIYFSTMLLVLWFLFALIGLLFVWLENTKRLNSKKVFYLLLTGITGIVIGVVGTDAALDASLEIIEKIVEVEEIDKGVIVAGAIFVALVVGGVARVGGGIVAASLLGKVWATLTIFIASPWQSIKVIPNNWHRIVFCVDMFHPPELMPGIEGKKYADLTDPYDLFRFGKWISNINDGLKKDWSGKYYALFYLSLSPLIYFPALAYRWSLKSSCLVWLPLIWLTGGKEKRAPGIDENQWFTMQLELAQDKIKPGYYFSYVVILVFNVLPLLFLGKGRQMLEVLQVSPHSVGLTETPFFNFFFVLNFHYEYWHLAQLIAAFLTILLSRYVNQTLIKRKHLPEHGLESGTLILGFATKLLTVLVCYSCFCALYLLLQPIDFQPIWENMHWLPFFLPLWNN